MSTVQRGQGYQSPAGQSPNMPNGPAEGPAWIPRTVTYQQITDALAILGLNAGHVTDMALRANGRGHTISVALDRIPGYPPGRFRIDATIHVEGPPAREPSLHTQWAALEDDGSWTSGADDTRAEAEEIVAARPETTLARRWVGKWQTPRETTR